MTTVAVDAARARARVDRIKTGVEVVWTLIVESYEARDWEALGYASWDDLCTREFGTARLRLPREERSETVQSLRASGLSVRAIAAVTGDSKSTVAEIASGVQIRTPDIASAPLAVDYATGEVLDAEPAEVPEHRTPVTGIDGKTYNPQPKPNRKPPRTPLIDTAKTRGFAIRAATDSLLRVFEDDRYPTNEKQVADVLRGHLLYVAETVAAVLDQLP